MGRIRKFEFSLYINCDFLQFLAPAGAATYICENTKKPVTSWSSYNPKFLIQRIGESETNVFILNRKICASLNKHRLDQVWKK